MNAIVALAVVGLILWGLHAVSRGNLMEVVLAIGIRLLCAIALNTVVLGVLVGVVFKDRPHRTSEAVAVGIGLWGALLVVGSFVLGIRAARRRSAPTGRDAELDASIRAIEEMVREGTLFDQPLIAGPVRTAARTAPRAVPTAAAPVAAAPVPSAKAHRRSLADRIPSLKPREIDAKLESRGYVGQPEARRMLGMAARLHTERAKLLLRGDATAADFPGRNHVLLMGPTGSGKSHLVELLFGEVLRVPTLVVNTPQFTSSGYVGEDVSAILTRLVESAGGDADWAACGVVCLDEFDKLAGDSQRGFSRDVGGYGVQRELLHLLSGATAEYLPSLRRDESAAPARMSLAGITFIACGAFEGIEDRGEVPDTAAFVRFGFMPELVGRFTGGITRLEPLGEAELTEILRRTVLPAAEKEAKLLGVSLKTGAAEQRAIVQTVMRRGTGARGLVAEARRAIACSS